jgi:hypothetical protein
MPLNNNIQEISVVNWPAEALAAIPVGLGRWGLNVQNRDQSFSANRLTTQLEIGIFS